MSIPRRLWRILRGRVVMARGHRAQRGLAVDPPELDRLRELAVEAEAAAQAARELAEATRDPDRGLRESSPSPIGHRAERGHPQSGTARSVVNRNHSDPHAADYALLQLPPEADLAGLEAAYQARLEENRPERLRAGSPEREHVEARRRAIEAAYERLRDALNPTETRFERLEF